MFFTGPRGQTSAVSLATSFSTSSGESKLAVKTGVDTAEALW